MSPENNLTLFNLTLDPEVPCRIPSTQPSRIRSGIKQRKIKMHQLIAHRVSLHWTIIYTCANTEEFVFMRAKSLQSCSTLCDPMDFSLPGSSVHGIPQARILKWVAMPSSRVSSGYPGSMQWLDLHLLCLLHWQVGASLLVPPGKSTEEFLSVVSHSLVSNSLRPHVLGPASLLYPWNSVGKNSRMGSCSLLQGIFWTQGSNPGLPHCRWILYHLSHQESVSYVFCIGR